MKPKEIFYFVLYLVMIVSLLMTIGSRDIAEQADSELINDMVNQLMKPPKLITQNIVNVDPKRSVVIPLLFENAVTNLERRGLEVSASSDNPRLRFRLTQDDRLNWQLSVDPSSQRDTFEVALRIRGVRQLPERLSESTYEMIFDTLNMVRLMRVDTVVVDEDTLYYIQPNPSQARFRIAISPSEDKPRDPLERIK